MSDWKPIATAPKDRPVVVWCPNAAVNERMIVSSWSEYGCSDGCGEWISEDGQELEPTVWYDVPPPPENAATGG